MLSLLVNVLRAVPPFPKLVSMDPSGRKRVTRALLAVVSETLPATTIFPSVGWIATECGDAGPPALNTTEPPLPKVGSRTPPEVNRINSRLLAPAPGEVTATTTMDPSD